MPIIDIFVCGIRVYLRAVCFVLVVLLDTTTEPSLHWTTYPYGPDANAAGVSTFIRQHIFH